MIWHLKIRKNISGSDIKKGKYKERNTFVLREKLRSLVSSARILFYVPCSKF